MMLTSRRTRRIIFVLVVLALTVGPSLVIVFSTTTSTGEGAGEPASDGGFVPALVVVTVGVLVLVGALSLMRESSRFLRVAAGFTTIGLVSFGVSLIFIAGSVIDGSMGFGSDGLEMSSSSIEVVGDSGTSWGRSPSGDGEQQPWLQRQFGAGADYASNSTVRVVAESPSAIAWALSWVQIALQLIAVGGALWLLRKLLLRSVDGTPFDPQNTDALRGIAGFVALGWFAGFVIEPLAQRAVIASAGGDGSFSFGGSLWPLLAAVFVLALSEVWRYGIERQRDAEVTI